MNKKKQCIYIMTIYCNKGGPRSLHQLALTLNNHGLNAYIYYIDSKMNKCVCDDIKVPVAQNIEDECGNFLIIPESFVDDSIKYHNIRKIVWWLSLYFYKDKDPIWHARFLLNRKGLPNYLFPIYLPYHYLKKFSYYHNNHYKEIDSTLDQYLHLYNCEYARQYLESKGIQEQNMHYLCGPLTGEFEKNDFHDCLNAKKDIIAINPVKVDGRILRKFKEALKPYEEKIKLVEIKGMTPAQVNEALLETKVYVDLGYFPGPERMPREAVMAYCAVFASTVGAAENDVDVPIPRKYKCDLQKDKMSDIVARIVKMVDDYENIVHDFDIYRDKVVDQINRFDRDVKEIFTGIIDENSDGK